MVVMVCDGTDGCDSMPICPFFWNKKPQIIGSDEGYEKKKTILSRFSNYLILIDLFQEFKFHITD